MRLDSVTLESWWPEVRAVVRSLLRSPGLTSVVTLSLIIALGSATAVVHVVDALFWRPLPLPKPEQLFVVEHAGEPISLVSADLKRLQRSEALPHIEGYRLESFRVVARGQADDLWVDLVSGGYLDLLGVPPAVGRSLTTEDVDDAARVVVISDALRRRFFGGRTDVLGSKISLNQDEFQIVGIMPPGFSGIQFGRMFELALPISASPTASSVHAPAALRLVGRLRTGQSSTATQSALSSFLQQCCPDALTHKSSIRVDDVAATAPSQRAGTPQLNTRSKVGTLNLVDASYGVVWRNDYRNRYRRLAIMVTIAAALFLCATWANACTLLLTRNLARDQELSVRLSLGAGPWQIGRLLLAEASLLVVPSCLLGTILARGLAIGIRAALPATELGLADALHGETSSWTFKVILVVAALTSVVVLALVPTVAVLRHTRPLGAARTPSRSIWGQTVARQLGVLQIAAAIVLLSGAWLFVSSVRHLTRLDGGYRTRDILLASLQMANCRSSWYEDIRRCFDSKLDPRPRLAAYEQARQVVASLPGVEGATLALNAPVFQDALMPRTIRIDGSGASPDTVRSNLVASGFFQTSGIGLVSGRDFTEADRREAEPVIIVSQTLALKYFGVVGAVGHDLVIDPGRPSEARARIIGIARDANYDRMAGPVTDLRAVDRAMIYVPIDQATAVPPVITMIVKTKANPRSLAAFVRARVDGPTLGSSRVVALSDVLDAATVRERMAGRIATAFGIVAAVIASFGLYGALTLDVRRRERELGVRAALGARPADAFLLVCRATIKMCALGAVVGCPAAIGLALVARTELFGVSATDPRIPLAVGFAVTVMALVVTIMPAWRAAVIDPAAAMRR